MCDPSCPCLDDSDDDYLVRRRQKKKKKPVFANTPCHTYPPDPPNEPYCQSPLPIYNKGLKYLQKTHAFPCKPSPPMVSPYMIFQHLEKTLIQVQRFPHNLMYNPQSPLLDSWKNLALLKPSSIGRLRMQRYKMLFYKTLVIGFNRLHLRFRTQIKKLTVLLPSLNRCILISRTESPNLTLNSEK
ncbi:hypothetical protein CISIN_1g030033mg [Citrus sinensis]|uniref:Uncharacterized protein n=1 Tax=Citrus sinensis TaxID=2711 RepID=A0A067FH44_CITSI|nr:hypothetical protein CISIN_1g030033mg [Citrus sinensis]